MNRKEFLNILEEEDVEFREDEGQNIFVRDATVLIYRFFGDELAYIIPDKYSIGVDKFDTTTEAIYLSMVTREDVMKMIEAYRRTNG